MRIGLFGGSFNPPHIGHGLVCFALLETTELEQIWIIPTFRHAFAKPLAPYDDRLEMCRLMALPFHGRVLVSDVERELGGVNYTIDTVRALTTRHPEHKFEWIIGADILRETGRWKDYQELVQLIRFRVLARGGYPGGGEVEMPQVSSTEVRERLRQGQPVSELLSRAVLDYIHKRGLYQETSQEPPQETAG